MAKYIPYGRQSISVADIEAVCDVLASDFLTQGPVLTQFEQAIADYVGAPHAVAVNSATSALHVACLALGITEQDWVWTSPNTFIASANCARYCGAKVDFVDIDPQTYNLCPRHLEAKLKQAKSENSLPKVVIPVHFAGHPCEMEAIYALSQEYGFYIIEDASHAIGAKYQGLPIGQKWSDICVFSFHPVKVMTSGEGGVAVTRYPQLADSMRMLANQGVERDPQQFQNASPGAWYYEQPMLGFNYRMTEMQAALGLSQIKRLDHFIQKRHHLAEHYYCNLRGLPLTLPHEADYAYSSWHLFPILLPEALAEQRAVIFQRLRDEGIGTQVHYIPVHTQPYYQQLGFQWGDFPEAEDYYQRTLTLPLFPDMTADDVNTVCDRLRAILDQVFVL